MKERINQFPGSGQNIYIYFKIRVFLWRGFGLAFVFVFVSGFPPFLQNFTRGRSGRGQHPDGGAKSAKRKPRRRVRVRAESLGGVVVGFVETPGE